MTEIAGNTAAAAPIALAAPDEATTLRIELARWRRVGQRLWPHVRHFGLCGAAPEAIETVAELAALLGRGDGSAAANQGAIAAAVAETKVRVTADLGDFVKNSVELRAEFGRNFVERAGEAIRRLRVQ